MVDWYPPLIWQWNLFMLGNKNQTLQSKLIFSFEAMGLVLFNKQLLPYTLGRRGETFTHVWSFKLSYYICNLCWILILALKVGSNLILAYFSSTNQTYCSCVFSMEGRRNKLDLWYLMPQDKSSKVECRFCSKVISYCKDWMVFHLGYWHDGNGPSVVGVCSRAWP